MSVSLEQKRSQRSRLRILEAAFSLFSEQGYEKTTFRQIAQKTDHAVGLICRYFPTKEHIVLAFYEQVSFAFTSTASDIPKGTAGERFAWVLRKKLALLTPYRSLLHHLFVPASDSSQKISVFSEGTKYIRTQGLSVFKIVLQNATPVFSQAEKGASLLYGVHLLIVLLWLQDQSKAQTTTQQCIDLVKQSFEQMELFLSFPPVLSLLLKLSGLSEKLLQLPLHCTTTETAQAVLRLLFSRARLIEKQNFEDFCFPHQEKLEALMEERQPLHFVLPGFPAKSPNPQKVLGVLPDLAEWTALQSLADLCKQIQHIYSPGARITLCSDGYVFSDVVLVSEKQVAEYQEYLEKWLSHFPMLSLFGLGDAFLENDSSQARELLLTKYGISEEEFQKQSKESKTLQNQINGIHRFLTEDEMGLYPKITRSQAQKQTRARAYEVVRRSQAWSYLISTCFPKAIRFSIHPQPQFSDKIGIHLLPTDDEWLTPWHGVLVIQKDHVCLMKKREAEQLGAKLVFEKGRPSHFEMDFREETN